MKCLFNAENGHASDEAFVQAMRGCCGSEAWCQAMLKLRPISDFARLKSNADTVFAGLTPADWLQSFECHPKIGDVDSLRMKYAGNDKWSQREQSGVTTADNDVIERLARGNEAYEAKFGYIFIVCATGKSAAEMLRLLEDRLGNDAEDELAIAAAEQRKITHLRIDKLVSELQSDIGLIHGQPHHHSRIGHWSGERLLRGSRSRFITTVHSPTIHSPANPIGTGTTDDDGRVANGLVSDEDYQPGVYRLCFGTRDYFQRMGQDSFYPEVVIVFEVVAGQAHYHVPLLLNRFGYSTYRGS